ncbi:tetratricopeptide repeat protein [Streptomyces sp. NPDC059568]|uniref:tetratricopeptide repeat protein n=1 Tax=Streptomyces sp. NPDC059568 TaxID=3346868 RepID=UPI0036D16A9A
MVTGAAAPFWSKLQNLHEAAGRRTLGRLMRVPSTGPIPGASTLNDWLAGKTVPSRRFEPYFMALVDFLQQEAAQRVGYAARPEAWWQQQLASARRDRDSQRGGRPPGARSSEQPSRVVLLPARPLVFAARHEELHRTLSWMASAHGSSAGVAPVLPIVGMPGVGKTAMALQAARLAHDKNWFPGGIIYLDLHGYSHELPLTPDAVAERLLRATGLRDKELPPTGEERLALWHVRLEHLSDARRPLLVIFDNVNTTAQIAGLLPSGLHRMLVTSRRRLSDLPFADIRLNPLTQGEGVDLLTQALQSPGIDRAERENDRRLIEQAADAERLVELCGGLPLALVILAALLRDERERPLRDQVTDLASARSRLDVLTYDDTDRSGRSLAVRAVLNLSYQHLTEKQGRALHLLACSPGTDVATPAAAALLGESAAVSRRLLVGLARVHLLTQGPQDRWSMHDLVRLHALEHGIPVQARDSEREKARLRLYEHYITMAAEAVARLSASGARSAVSPSFHSKEDASAWLEAERANVVDAAVSAPQEGHPEICARLSSTLMPYFDRYRYIDDWLTVATAAWKSGSVHGDPEKEISALGSLGMALRESRRFAQSLEVHLRELAGAQRTNDYVAQARSLDHLGLAWRESGNTVTAERAHARAAWLFEQLGLHHDAAGPTLHTGRIHQINGRLEQAIDHFRQAAYLFTLYGDRRSAALALGNMGGPLILMGRCREAIEVCQDSVRLADGDDGRYPRAIALSNMGTAYASLGLTDTALSCYGKGAELFQQLRDHRNLATALDSMSVILTRQGKFTQAREAHQRAETSLRRLSQAP